MALDYARFLRAQDPVWSSVVAELTLGRKQTHWMWFVFPQLRGLGRSETAIFFGLEDAAAARDFVAHPLLGERLSDACQLLRAHTDKTAEEIFGPVDAMKLRSSMTLFEVTPQLSSCAAEVLDQFFSGKRCELTRERLSSEPSLQPGQ